MRIGRGRQAVLTGILCVASAGGVAGQEASKTSSPFEKRYSFEQVSHLPTDERIATLEKKLKAEPDSAQVELALGCGPIPIPTMDSGFR